MIAMPNEVFLAFIGASVLLGGLLTWFFTGPLIPPRMKAHYDSVWRERCEARKARQASENRQRDLERTLLAQWKRMQSPEYLSQALLDLETREMFPDETDWWEDVVMD